MQSRFTVNNTYLDFVHVQTPASLDCFPVLKNKFFQ